MFFFILVDLFDNDFFVIVDIHTSLLRLMAQFDAIQRVPAVGIEGVGIGEVDGGRLVRCAVGCIWNEAHLTAGGHCNHFLATFQHEAEGLIGSNVVFGSVRLMCSHIQIEHTLLVGYSHAAELCALIDCKSVTELNIHTFGHCYDGHARTAVILESRLCTFGI